LIIEGSFTRQVKELIDSKKPFANLYEQTKKAEVIDCIYKACSSKMGSLESAKEQNLPICGEMSGHPGISRYMKEGYAIMIF